MDVARCESRSGAPRVAGRFPRAFLQTNAGNARRQQRNRAQIKNFSLPCPTCRRSSCAPLAPRASAPASFDSSASPSAFDRHLLPRRSLHFFAASPYSRGACTRRAKLRAPPVHRPPGDVPRMTSCEKSLNSSDFSSSSSLEKLAVHPSFSPEPQRNHFTGLPVSYCGTRADVSGLNPRAASRQATRYWHSRRRAPPPSQPARPPCPRVRITSSDACQSNFSKNLLTGDFHRVGFPARKEVTSWRRNAKPRRPRRPRRPQRRSKLAA